MSRDKTFPQEKYFYPPAKAAQTAREEIDQRDQIDLNFGMGVPEMDKFVVPYSPGILEAVIGRPGHGKTALAIAKAKYAEKVFKARKQDKRYVVYCTWETTVTQFVSHFLTEHSGQTWEMIVRRKADLNRYKDALAIYGTGRIVVVGRAPFQKRSDKNKPLSRSIQTLNDLYYILAWMTENDMPPGYVILDYIQRCKSSTNSTKKIEYVPENVGIAKDMALEFECPFTMMSQARASVDDYSAKNLKMPEMGDGEWTAAIEQDADIVTGITKPIEYLDPPFVISFENDGVEYELTDRTVVLKNWKNRGARAIKTFVLDIDWARHIVTTAKPTPIPF